MTLPVRTQAGLDDRHMVTADPTRNTLARPKRVTFGTWQVANGPEPSICSAASRHPVGVRQSEVVAWIGVLSVGSATDGNRGPVDWAIRSATATPVLPEPRRTPPDDAAGARGR